MLTWTFVMIILGMDGSIHIAHKVTDIGSEYKCFHYAEFLSIAMQKGTMEIPGGDLKNVRAGCSQDTAKPGSI